MFDVISISIYAPGFPATPFVVTLELYSLPFCVEENRRGWLILLESLKSKRYLFPVVTLIIASCEPLRKYTLDPKPLFATVTPIFTVV